MEGSLGKWKLSLAETLAFGCTIAALTLWAVDRFQTKSDAQDVKISLERRMEALEDRQKDLQIAISQIASDVSYIRGRIEPKGAKE